MEFRHEWKHEINYADYLVLKSRLSSVMKTDKHTIDGRYTIRSLYFDTPSDKALREKTDGVNIREKFRIRYYNGDKSYIVLEKKCKFGGLSSKYDCIITADDAQRTVDGDIGWMKERGDPLCMELYVKMKSERLAPKTIVDYTRRAYVFPAGNVRATIDYDIRTGIHKTDFLNPDTVTVPAGDPIIIFEVKWDEFLPDIIRDAVSLPNRRVSSFSKYAQCRIYG